MLGGIRGTVSGFFAAFGDTVTVLIAGSTTAVAGLLSMAAGAYVELSSEMRWMLPKKTTTILRRGFCRRNKGTTTQFVSRCGRQLFCRRDGTLAANCVWSQQRTAVADHGVQCHYPVLHGPGILIRDGYHETHRDNLVILAGAVGLTYAIGLIAKRFQRIPL